MHAGEPALLEDGGKDLAGGFFPNGGGERFAVFVEGEGLEGVLDVGGDGGVDEGVFGRSGWEESDVRDAERTDGIPDADGFDGDVEPGEAELWWLSAGRFWSKVMGELGILRP